MRYLAFFSCALLVAIPSLYRAAAHALSFLDVRLPAPPGFQLLRFFGSLVPPMAASVVPRAVAVALVYMLALLVLRRLWRMFARGEAAPAQFNGLVLVLGYVGVVCVALAATLLWLAAELRVGLGAVSGVLLLPAAIAVPWAFFLAETGNLLGRKG